MDLDKRKVEPLFDHERLAKILTDTLKVPIKANDLPLTTTSILGEKRMELSIRGKIYILELPAYTLTPKKINDENWVEQVSPSEEWIAYTENYNLYIRSAKTGVKKQLSYAGQKDYEYGSYYGWSDIIEGENGTRPERFTVQWSPDSKWIQTFICDLRSGNKMYLLNWGIDTVYRPQLLSYYRASPGDTGMVYMIPVFFNIETGQEIRRDKSRTTHTFPASYEWTSKEGIILEEIMKRGFQELVLNEIDISKNKERQLYRETSKTNIDNFNSNWIEDGDKIIILSDKDGWRQVYIVDAKDVL